jgi:hypothetical protein
LYLEEFVKKKTNPSSCDGCDDEYNYYDDDSGDTSDNDYDLKKPIMILQVLRLTLLLQGDCSFGHGHILA